MRNRSLIIISCIVLALAFASPLEKYALCELGIMRNTNVGNVIELEKVYEEGSPGASLLNGFEEFKRDLKDIYTNYFPFYVETATIVNSAEEAVNRPLQAFLFEKGNEIAREKLQAASSKLQGDGGYEEELQAEEVTGDRLQVTGDSEPESRRTGEPETEQRETSNEQRETSNESPAAEIIDYDGVAQVSYLKNDDRYNYYRIISAPEGEESVEFYVRIILDTTESLRERMLNHVEKYNAISENYPVNLYIYAATTFHDTASCQQLIPSVAQREMFLEFFTLLDEDIKAACTDIDSVKDYADKFWATDIHWNNTGYAEAYEKIVSMLNENYGDIEPRQGREYVFEDVDFYGSYAIALSNYSLADSFAVTLYDLPEHEFSRERSIESCSQVPASENLEIYLAGNYPRFQTYNHYMQFFPIAHEISYPENSTGRNLLLICDSYSPALQAAIASHFDKTYLRYMGTQQYTPPNVDLQYYVDLGVTDVMVLEMSDRAIYDCYKDSLAFLEISRGEES